MGDGSHSASTDILVLRLLKSYGSKRTPVSQVRLPDRDVEALYTLGLHFLVLDGVRTGSATVSPKMQDLLDSADLTARVVYGQLCTVLEQVLTIAAERSIPVVALKGITNARDLYLQSHHRTMGDVDVLVPPEHAETLYQQLLDSGYQRTDPSRGMIWEEGHHHLQPLAQRHSGVPVEIHTALFSGIVPDLVPDLCRTFAHERVWALTEKAKFRGKPCLKLGRDLNLLYAIAHFAIDLRRIPNATAFCDLVRMLIVRGADIDWVQIRHWLDESPLLTDNFAVIIDFLDRTGIAGTSDAIQETVAESVERIGKLNLRALQFLLGTFSLTDRQSFAGIFNRWHAHIVWDTVLEPGDRSGRLLEAASRLLNLNRRPGEPLVLTLLRRAKEQKQRKESLRSDC